MKEEDRNSTNLLTLENFITRLHEKEVIDGQIREILYDIIYNIDDTSNIDSPIVYKIVLANNNNSHRLTRTKTSSDCIVHCRCGSVYDENSLVQCYACQVRLRKIHFLRRLFLRKSKFEIRDTMQFDRFPINE
jgi:hypothetical protein